MGSGARETVLAVYGRIFTVNTGEHRTVTVSYQRANPATSCSRPVLKVFDLTLEVIKYSPHV